MTLEAFVKRTGETLKEHAPSILAGLGVAGVVTTGYFSHQAGYKTGRDMEYFNLDDPNSEMTGKEKVRRYWTNYITPVAAGALAITCVVGATVVSNRRNAILMGAVTLGEQTIREWREKTEQLVTKQKMEQIETGIAQDKVNNASSNEVVIIGNGEQLYFDTLTGRYFRSSKAAIERAEIEINRQILHDMYVSQNEWYDKLGLPRIDNGDSMGWNNDTPLEIKWSAVIKEVDGVEQPVGALGYRFLPKPDFSRFG